MSRVYNTPRYENQTAYKVLSHIDVADTYLRHTRHDFAQTVRSAMHDKAFLDLPSGAAAHRMGMFCDYDYELAETAEVEDLSEERIYAKYSYAEGLQVSRSNDQVAVAAIGKALHDILAAEANPKGKERRLIYTDWAATSRLTQQFLLGRYRATVSPKDNFRLRWASGTALDCSAMSLAACRYGSVVVSTLQDRIVHFYQADSKWLDMKAWAYSFEQLRLMGRSASGAAAHKKAREGCLDIPISDFRTTGLNGPKAMRVRESYRVLGINILVFDDAIYLLDFSSLDQIQQVAAFWAGTYSYANNYRISGMLSEDKPNLLGAVGAATQWIGNALEKTNQNNALPRSMKQSLALVQNEFHSHAEKLDVKWEYKSERLRAAIAEILPLDMYWHEFLMGLAVPDRTRLDVANLYYGLPAPDCNLISLINKGVEYMATANKADPIIFSQFMKYRKSVDLAKVLTREKAFDRVGYAEEEGYSLTEQPWAQKCIRGELTLPLDADMGKAWLSEHFEYNNTIDTWYYDAGDVTHVYASKAMYQNPLTMYNMPRFAHNELLYALEMAPLLSARWQPRSILPAIRDYEDNWDRICLIAAKCENTKPGDKVRETWSGDDITRELTSCYDRQGIPLCRLYKGVTARKSVDEIEEIFGRINDVTKGITREGKEVYCVIISNDVSGWSPKGDRDAWAEHHDYVVGTTKAPKELKLKRIWKRPHMFMNKRGVACNFHLASGLFQGWTATLDSLLNVGASLYSVRESKRSGRLYMNEGATTAGVGDDAVQAVELGTDKAHAQDAADHHFVTTEATWRALGAEIDPVKTIYSSIKFIYLNRFYCEGSEVLTPLKIYARADRELNRRFAGIFAQCDTVMGGFRAAVERGACPIATYHAALTRCLELCSMTSKLLLAGNVTIARVLNAMFAPRGLGGWGFPLFTGWLSQEAPDPLVSYCCLMTTAASVIQDPIIAQECASLLTTTLSQELAIVHPAYFLTCPTVVHAKGVHTAESAVFGKLKKGMMEKCKSPVFRDLLAALSQDVVNPGIEKVLESTTWDAVILEVLGQCTPSACASALIDRAYKNELISTLFPFAVRSNLSREVKNQGRKCINHLLTIEMVYAKEIPSRMESVSLATDLRDAFYDTNGVSIVNHTLPDYATCLARQSTRDCAMVTVKIGTPGPACEKSGEKYVNMYDGTSIRRRAPISRSPYVFSGDNFSGMNRVDACVQKGAMCAAYVESRGGAGKVIWDMVCAMWGVTGTVSPPVVHKVVESDVSTKRLSPSLSTRKHPLACYPNVHGIIDVDTTNLLKYVDRAPTNVDVLSFVQAGRIVGLVEAACGAPAEYEYHFAVLEGTLEPRDSTTCRVDDAEGLRTGLELIRSGANHGLEDSFMMSMRTYSYEPGEDGFVFRVDFDTPLDHVETEATRVTVRPGQLADIMCLSMPTSSNIVSRHPVVRVVGEETTVRAGVTLEAAWRRYCSYMDERHAVLALLMDMVHKQTGKYLNDRFYTCAWREVGDVVSECIPEWYGMWSNAVRAVRRYWDRSDQQLITHVFHDAPYAVTEALIFLRSNDDEYCRAVFGRLLLMSHGRMPCGEAYTMTSAVGHRLIAKCWRFAAKRQRLLARTMVNRRRGTQRQQGEEEKARELVSSLYRQMSVAAKQWDPAFRGKSDLMLGIHQAVVQYLAEIQPNMQLNVPVWDTALLDRPVEEAATIILQDIVHLLRQARSPAAGAPEVLRRPLENILEDVRCMGTNERLFSLAQPTLRLMGSAPLLTLDLERPDDITMREEGLGNDIEEEEAPNADRVITAAFIYASGRPDDAFAWFCDENAPPVEMLWQPEQEDIEEFLEAYEAWTNDVHGSDFQQGDEL